jgi:arylsulfatase A-like enzyme
LAARRVWAQGAPAGRKPNIVVILADDLGYADLGCQGCEDVPTPNLDSLARNGVRFTDGHVSCPVCSPTRAGLMTGRYQQRYGHEFNPGPAQTADPQFGLPLSQITMADALKAAGYATGLVGKWHLGYTPPYHPLKRGFDEFFGFLGGGHPYLPAANDRGNPILRGTEPVEEKEYLTDAFTREAVAFLERHHGDPFFLYLAFNAVHNPEQATPPYLDRFPKIAAPKRRTLAAKLSAMDDGVGAVLAKLKEHALLENTLIFFFSDNGGPTPKNGSRNTPLRGFKGQVYEGGVRIPFLLQWPGHVPAGKVYEQPVIALDIFPTVVTAAGGRIPGDRVMDGVNLLPFVTGESAGAPHERLFWRYGEQHAIRQGHWKLIRQGGTPDELYDLSADLGESKNVATQQVEVAAQLSQALGKWESELTDPFWGGRKRATAQRQRRRRGRQP